MRPSLSTASEKGFHVPVSCSSESLLLSWSASFLFSVAFRLPIVGVRPDCLVIDGLADEQNAAVEALVKIIAVHRRRRDVAVAALILVIIC